MIVAPNEDYIYDRSDVVHSSIEVFQRSVLQKALYDADAEAEKVCYPLKWGQMAFLLQNKQVTCG